MTIRRMPSFTSSNEQLVDIHTSSNAVQLDFETYPFQEDPAVKEYDDGVFIDFGGEPYDVEYHDAGVQVWRDRAGRIVAIDVVYEDIDDSSQN